MRLLHIDDHGTVRLTEELLSKDKTPAYAILSHTWGEEEVTFDDLTEGKGTDKIGFDKIRFCMQQAARDGLKFSWVDTCCIKKDNPTELQHSINSMFRWYKEAAKCYVYMADVSTSKQPQDCRTQNGVWREDFTRSRWFTRGWTLQELLAPHDVSFFSREGEMLGSLDKLKELVQMVTGLPLSVFSGTDLHTYGIEERLSWTAKRHTTREEDKAYSLLGIFNVFLPLIYGEGEDNAFRRLRSEIRERKNDAIAFARLSETELRCLSSISFSEQANRYHDILTAKETCEWLLTHPVFLKWRNSSCGLFWVKGNPGVGKSVLMKFAVDSLRKSDRAEIVLSYFVYGQGTELQRTPLGILRAILSDLLRQLPDHLGDLTKKFNEYNEQHGIQVGGWAWSQSELEREFERILKFQTGNRQITIFIDALDELGENSAKTLLRFFRTLTTELSKRNRQARFCVSSRHYPIIGHDTIPHVNVEQENSRDLAWYVRERVQEIESETAREEIERELLSKAQGAFQWVYLVTDSIIADDLIGLSHEALLRQIALCPENLGELYSTLLELGPEPDKRRTLALIQWILYAVRPLTAGALREALSVSANTHLKTHGELKLDRGWSDTAAAFDRYVKHLSKGLVRLQHLESKGWNSTAQLIHQSVADYLLDEAFDKLGTSNRKAAHLQLARACLRYLTYDEILHVPRLRPSLLDRWRDSYGSRDGWKLSYVDRSAFLPEFSLAEYATDYIIEHFICAGGVTSLESDLAKVYAAARDKYDRVRLLAASEGPYEASEGVIRQLLIMDPSAVETPDQAGLTAPLAALRVARKTYNFGAVNLILSLGRFSKQSLPLTHFFYELCETARQDIAGTNTEYFLHLWTLHGLKAVTRPLLDSDKVNINAIDTKARSMLWHAAKNGSDILVDLLVNSAQPIQIDAPDYVGITPLQNAVDSGIIRIVELLLDTGKVNVNAQDWFGRTSLTRARERGFQHMIEMFLACGARPAEIESIEMEYHRPFCHICKYKTSSKVCSSNR
ncbi:hypothetical protein E8E13_002798 [Curvularia kusanoi]|uniref:HET-domain-containing protein n=1 Tax=Curvularia kusanoi TaxID=90978 RepID=A0A9P4W7S1_CURKU|nr:hypothetical protein E8E13_002798 [Curvularia kusanoi]